MGSLLVCDYKHGYRYRPQPPRYRYTPPRSDIRLPLPPPRHHPAGDILAVLRGAGSGDQAVRGDDQQLEEKARNQAVRKEIFNSDLNTNYSTTVVKIMKITEQIG